MSFSMTKLVTEQARLPKTFSSDTSPGLNRLANTHADQKLCMVITSLFSFGCLFLFVFLFIIDSFKEHNFLCKVSFPLCFLSKIYKAKKIFVYLNED